MIRRANELKCWLLVAGLWVTSVILIGLLARVTWVLLRFGWELMP